MRPDHLDEAQIQELLDGEEAARAREHVNACPVCSRKLEEARAEERVVSALLERLDGPPPRVDPGGILAAASEPAAPGVETRDRRNRWVAAVLLAIGVAGAAYAIPGSPLREWVSALIPKVFDGKEPPGTSITAPAPQPRRLSGVAVTPGARFVITFARPNDGTLRVALVEGAGAQLMVRAPVGAASFQSEPDGLVIDPRVASTTFEVDIPRSAPHVEIRVGAERVFLKDGDRTEPPFQDPSAVIPLARSGR